MKVDALNMLASQFESSESAADYATKYLDRVTDLIAHIDPSTIAQTVTAIEAAERQGKTIYCIANGGSAAVASHFVNDLSPNTLAAGQPGLRSFSLTDNVESVTAIANDAGFEHIFSYQLQANMTPGDIVIAMSVSGNSDNIIRGVEYANDHGGYTIGWCGFEGGRLAELCKVIVHIPTTPDEYGPVESIFSHVAHIVSGYVSMRRGRKLAH